MDFFSNSNNYSTHQIKFKNNLNKISILRVFMLFKKSICNVLVKRNYKIYSFG